MIELDFDQIVIQEELFLSIKERGCLTRGDYDNLEGQVLVEPPLIGNYF